MKNLVVIALLASTASMAVWALPPQPATTINYCQGGSIAQSLKLHTNVSHATYTSGPGCVLAGGRLLNITAEPLQYSEANNTAPVTAEFTQSRVGEGAAINLEAPNYGFVDLMVPWDVRITDNVFENNGVVHFHGCLPANSKVTISGNTFAGATARNPLIDFADVAAISFGVVDTAFKDPLLFGRSSEIVIANNVISGVQGGFGVAAAGIRFVPTSFFMADHSRLAVRNNSVTATGYSTNPAIPFNFQGYINVIPEFEGNEDVAFEFSDNTAQVTNGFAWWLPGLWGPRGATDLSANIVGNKGTVNTIVNTEKFAAITSIINCTARGKLNYERNEVRVTGGEGLLIFYEQISEDHSVRVVDNVYKVGGGNARVTMQPWWGVKNVEVSGNLWDAEDNEANWQIASINGTNLDAVFSGNVLKGKTTLIGVGDVLMKGGKLAFGQTEMTSIYGNSVVNVQRTKLTDSAEVDWNEWAMKANNGAATFSFPVDVNLQSSKMQIRNSNLTSTNGHCIVNLGKTELGGDAVLDIHNNRLESAVGSPNLRFSDTLKASDEADVLVSFNWLYRTDKVESATMPFVYVGGAIELENKAEFGLWNNSFDARNNTLFVGMVAVQGNVAVGEEALVHICNNNYYKVANMTLGLMTVTPALAQHVDCSSHVVTAVPTTTLASTTATQDNITTGGQDDNGTTTTLFPTTNPATTQVGNNAPANAAAGVAFAAVLASLFALLQ